LIERYMSVAFNRIITQFRETPDLNVDMRRKDHNARVERPSSRERFSTGRQLCADLGTADGFNNGKMLGQICGNSGIGGEHIGRMMIKDVYSFADFEPEQFDQVSKSFQGANSKGRKLRVDEAEGGQRAPRNDGPVPMRPAAVATKAATTTLPLRQAGVAASRRSKASSSPSRSSRRRAGGEAFYLPTTQASGGLG